MKPPRPPDARKFAEIAAECARVCGLDVRLTPVDEVRIEVTAPGPPAPPQEVSCVGVRFDEEYVIVRLPGGSFRALKVDGAGRVVQRLDTRGGFRIHVSRVFGSLIWDRLKRGRSRYEPQLVVLSAESVVALSAESAQLESAEPEPAPVLAPSPPSQLKAKAPPPPPSGPPVDPAPRPPSGSGPGPDREPRPHAPSAPPPGPEPPHPVLPPPPSEAGGATPPTPPPAAPACPPPAAGPGAPLARRLRTTRSK
jgi:hypothetical protein